MEKTENVRNEQTMSLPSNKEQLLRWYSRGLRHPAMQMAYDALSMKRSPNQAFILLVGLTGAGKSSTVNYMFETDVASTNPNRSESRSTSEYSVTLESKEWRIPDLKLSIIDTPGLCDDDGLEQDAKNIVSIKYFLESHPNLKHYFPNLVMIILNINDNRIHGKSSNFAKMLNGIKHVKAIDNDRPNVVVVLTHATGIARNPKIWNEMVELKKAEVKNVVQIHLGLTPEIVVQENHPKNNLLKREGDWYLLPNNEKQPKVLYKACEKVLNYAKDKIGHEAVAIFFRPGINKSVSKGHFIEASTVKKEDITVLYAILCQSVVMVPISEVEKLLEDYKEKNDESLFQVILILQVRCRDIGINNANDLQGLSMNKLMIKFYPIRITNEMQKVLVDVFGISFEQFAGSDYHVGKGYNIFTDSATQFSPLVMHSDRRLKHGLAANVELTESASFKMKCETVGSTRDFVNKRLKELNIDVGEDFNLRAFTWQPRFGYNNHNESKFCEVANCKSSSFSIEYRMQKVKVTHPFELAEEFKADVNNLPEDYNLNDERNVINWKSFFDKWGMYVVTGGYLGGSVTGQVMVADEQSVNMTTEDVQVALAFKMALLQTEASFDSSTEDNVIFGKKVVSSIHSTKLDWNGGNKETYKLTLHNIDKSDWNAWVESLEYSSVPLWSSLDLYPLYQLASKVSKTKGEMMQMAMMLALEGKFVYKPPKEDNRTNTAVSNESGGCFHEESLVMLHNQKLRQMKDLSVGDKILTANNNGKFLQDEVIAWLHQVKDGQFTFLKIVHNLGSITLTPEHIIFVGKNRNPQHASTLRPGDELCFLTNDDDGQTVTMAIVLTIHKVEGRGMYAPLTYSGRLLVDKVDVSCYCSLNPLKVLGKDIISSHALAHAGFLPLRTAFKFGLNISSNKLNDETGIHRYAQWLMNIIFGEKLKRVNRYRGYKKIQR